MHEDMQGLKCGGDRNYKHIFTMGILVAFDLQKFGSALMICIVAAIGYEIHHRGLCRMMLRCVHVNQTTSTTFN
jgi:hypothetical protein